MNNLNQVWSTSWEKKRRIATRLGSWAGFLGVRWRFLTSGNVLDLKGQVLSWGRSDVDDSTKAWQPNNTLYLFLILQFTECCAYVVLFNTQTTLCGRHAVSLCRCEQPGLSNVKGFAPGHRACVQGASWSPSFLAVPFPSSRVQEVDDLL